MQSAPARPLRPPRALRALVVCCLAATGCATAPGPSAPSAPVAALGPLRTATFPHASAILAGFDDGATSVRSSSWTTGDRMLLGVRVEDGSDGHTWYVHIELAPRPADSDPRPAAPHPPITMEQRTLTLDGASRDVTLVSGIRDYTVRVHDEAGRLVATSTAPVAFQFLETGLYEACTAAAVADDENAPAAARLAAQETVLRGFRSMIAALDVIGGGAALDEVRTATSRTVLRRPGARSLLGAVLRGSLAVGLEPDFAAAARAVVPAPVPGWSGPVRRLPLRAETGGRAAIESALYVTPAAPPVHLSGGIVGVEARHPDDPDRRLTAVVLAARRGPVPAGQARSASVRSRSRVASSRIVGVPKTQ